MDSKVDIPVKWQRKWKRLQPDLQTGLTATLGISVTLLQEGEVKARMPVNRTVMQPLGYLHGGASAVLAETAASLGSLMLTDSEVSAVAGQQISAHHLRPVKEGSIHAHARMIHRGRTTHLWDISISDDKDRLVCTSRCTIAIVEKK